MKNTLLIISIMVGMMVHAGASFLWQGRVLMEDGSLPSSKVTTITFSIQKKNKTNATNDILWSRKYMVILDNQGACEVLLTDESGTQGEIVEKYSLSEALRLAYESLTDHFYLLAKPQQTYQVENGLISIGLSPMATTAVYAGSGIPKDSTQQMEIQPFTISGSLQAQQITINGKMEVSESVQFVSSDSAMPAFATDTLNFNKGQITTKRFIGGGFAIKGMIVPYIGNIDALPDGWVLCDGENGTPDLRNRFVVGAGRKYALGDQGGEAQHRLTLQELPVHSHTFNYTVAASFTGYPNGGKDSGNEEDSKRSYWRYGQEKKISQTLSTGLSQPHENRPPYYRVYFIMLIK